MGRTFRNQILLLILFSVSAIAPVEATRTVKVGYIEFPPIFYTNEQGKPVGILIDLIRRVLPRAGFNWTAQSYPTKRMISNLVAGKIDLWVGLPTIPAFQGKTLVGQSEVFKITLRSFHIGEKRPVKSKTDLNDKKIIIMSGYSYGGWIHYIKDPLNRVQYLLTNSHESALKMLKAGRADYLLDYKYPAEKALETLEIPGLQHNEISALGIHFVVSSKAQDAAGLLEAIETAYQALLAEGTLVPKI